MIDYGANWRSITVRICNQASDITGSADQTVTFVLVLTATTGTVPVGGVNQWTGIRLISVIEGHSTRPGQITFYRVGGNATASKRKNSLK